MSRLADFDFRVCGIPCSIVVTSFSYTPAIITGRPETSYPAEGECEYEIHVKGQRAKWLEDKVDDREEEIIQEEIFNWMMP